MDATNLSSGAEGSSFASASPAPSHASSLTPASASAARMNKLSYKFQRLRERLRQAIASGELSGKLPGERQLARKFRVNAKTLSKALTDLAAEGLLDRSIGRGTYVKGSEPAPQATSEKWLIVCDPGQADSPVVRAIAAANSACQLVTETASLRPSFLSQFKAVIDFGSGTPETFLRDMVVRNMTVVLVDREPGTYSMHAVVLDRALAAARLARDMMLAGHRRFVAVEQRGRTQVADAIRATAVRVAPDASVEIAYPSEVLAALENGASAIICDSRLAAQQVKQIVEQAGATQRVSLAAIDSADAELPCNGYYVDPEQQAQTILQILADTSARRPTTLWLAGSYYDCGTCHPLGTDTVEPALQTPRVGGVVA